MTEARVVFEIVQFVSIPMGYVGYLTKTFGLDGHTPDTIGATKMLRVDHNLGLHAAVQIIRQIADESGKSVKSAEKSLGDILRDALRDALLARRVAD